MNKKKINRTIEVSKDMNDPNFTKTKFRKQKLHFLYI